MSSVDPDQLRKLLKPGDVILYRDKLRGFRSLVVTKPNPMWIGNERGERVFYKRVEGVGRDAEAAEAAVLELAAEGELHFEKCDDEHRRHKAAIADILRRAR